MKNPEELKNSVEQLMIKHEIVPKTPEQRMNDPKDMECHTMWLQFSNLLEVIQLFHPDQK